MLGQVEFDWWKIVRLPKAFLIYVIEVKTYGQRLPQQVSVGFSIDSGEGVEPVIRLKSTKGKLLFKNQKTAIEEAQKDVSDLALWLDGSKLESGGAGAAVVWKNPVSHRWGVQNFFEEK